MPNPNGNPAGKPPDAITLEHGGRRVKVDQRWPTRVVARVDHAARLASEEEGRPVTRTEWTIRAVLRELARQDIERDVEFVAVEHPWSQPNPVPLPDGAVEQATCLHPKDARVQLGYMTRCGICNKRMDK